MQRAWTRRRWAQWGAPAALLPLAHVLPSPARAAAPAWHLAPGAQRAAQAAVAPLLKGRRGGVAICHLPSGQLALIAGEEAACRTLARPGSTVKPFLLHRLLRDGHMSERSEHVCRGRLRIADRQLDCSHPPVPGPLAPQEALALSCNEFFAHFAGRLAPGDLASSLREFGVGSRQVFGRDCAPASVQQPASPDQELLQALGEAALLTTPLAMLHAYATLLGRAAANPSKAESRVLLAGMRACVEFGTGRDAAVPGLAVAGKTGTGSAADRSFLNGWFLSYAPAEAPVMAMVVFVENARGGPEAAPIAGAAWKALAGANALA